MTGRAIGTEPLDLTRTFLHFTREHGISAHSGGPELWDDLRSRRLTLDGRLVGCVQLDGPGDHWESHPAGDEFLMLMSGAVTVVFEQTDGTHTETRLKPGQACVVPTGIWHTVKAQAPSTLFFATAGAGTQHRPA